MIKGNIIDVWEKPSLKKTSLMTDISAPVDSHRGFFFAQIS